MIAEGLPRPAMLGLALCALKAAGCRGVILGGWARLHELGAKLVADLSLDGLLDGLDVGGSLLPLPTQAELADFASTRVCFVAEAPHDWLLPRCCCVVHHGGAGTTQSVLRAGVPSVITPIYGDQFGNAQTLRALGAGVGFEQRLTDVSHSQLADAILEAEQAAPKAAELGAQLWEEASRGVRDAAGLMDRFFRGEVKTGRFADKLLQVRSGARGGGKGAAGGGAASASAGGAAGMPRRPLVRIASRRSVATAQ
mmetsp:Transcript_147667/g.472466  ORF Transcript_147667/g.472466 Transcript_147667/m.472466 type:complete len:254 (+) Transcript_147667:370-1131(+)